MAGFPLACPEKNRLCTVKAKGKDLRSPFVGGFSHVGAAIVDKTVILGLNIFLFPQQKRKQLFPC